MTEVVEIIEGEVAVPKELTVQIGRAGVVRPRPNRPSHQQPQNILKSVTEFDETAENLSASIRSFDGIDNEALRRLSAFEDSERSNRTGLSTLSEGGSSLSSSSSSGMRMSSRNSRMRKMTEQVRIFGVGGSLDGSERERFSISSYDDRLGSSMSLSSHAVSKSSMNSLGFMFELGELSEDLPGGSNSNPGQDAGSKGPLSSAASTSNYSMPSLSDFSAAPSTTSSKLLPNSAHSSVMPSLGDIQEEEISTASFSSFNTGTSFNTRSSHDNIGVFGAGAGISASSFKSFDTGSSFNTSARSSITNDNAAGGGGVNDSNIIIGGRPMSEVLKEQEKIAGTTLDALAPTIKQKKPTMQRWASVETQITSNANANDAGHHVDSAPMIASRRISDTSSTDQYTAVYRELAEPPSPVAADLPPQMVGRHDSTSSQQLPDLSPLGLSARGRFSAIDSSGRRKSIPELSPPRGGGRKELSPPRGGGRKELSPPQGGGRKELSPPRGGGRKELSPPRGGGRVETSSGHGRKMANYNYSEGGVEESESTDMEHSEWVEECDDMTPAAATAPPAAPARFISPKICETSTTQKKKPRPISPKIWSRSGTKRIPKNDLPPVMANRRISG